MANLKVAIVGTGNVARSNYLPVLSKQRDVSLAYVNRTRAKAEACATDFGGEVFGSPSDVAAWEPDTVLVLTREMDRLDAASALLDTGVKRLFFEKPLVAREGQEHVTEQDFADARSLLDRARNQGCETAMVFNYRFLEHSLLATRLIAERDLGRVLNVTALVHYACWSHCIDLVHALAGPVAEITALSGETVHEWGSMQARDVTAALRTVGDATGTLIGTTTLTWEHPLFEMTFGLERGRIRFQDLDGDMEVMDAGRHTVERYSISRDRSRWDQYRNSFARSITAYLDAIRQDQPPPVPGQTGLLELQVEAGLRRSIADRRPVVLADDFPLT
jgi:predicted dehydrogenase